MALRVRAWLVLLGWSGAACVEARPGSQALGDDAGAAAGGAAGATGGGGSSAAGGGDPRWVQVLEGASVDRVAARVPHCAPPEGAEARRLLTGLAGPRRIVARAQTVHVEEEIAIDQIKWLMQDWWVTCRSSLRG